MRIITFQKVLQESSVPQATLGERAVTEDGRVWIYVKAGEGISKGHAVVPEANTDVDTVYTSQNSASQNVFITEASAGWTVGLYQNAWGLVDDGTNEGQYFKVKDNSADTLEVYEDYALSTALTVAAADDIVLARPYLAMKSAITTVFQRAIGIAQIALTNTYYGWVLREGPGCVLAGEALTADLHIQVGAGTEGEVMNVDDGDDLYDASVVGQCIIPNTTADKLALLDVNIF